MKKKRLTTEELQRMPKDRFPLTVECDNGEFAYGLEKITILNNEKDTSGLFIAIDGFGRYFAIRHKLSQYPSFEPDEPEEVE